jgi:hypothetical protein
MPELGPVDEAGLALLGRAEGLYAAAERGEITDAAAFLREALPAPAGPAWAPPPLGAAPPLAGCADPAPFDHPRWAADGFVCAGPALDAAGVAAVAAAGDRVIEACFASAGMARIEDWAARVTQISDPELWDPTFAALADAAPLRALASAALGGVPARCLWAHLVIKPPGVGAGLPWHTDRPTWPFPAAVPAVAIWLALDPLEPTSGGLAYQPGSHRPGGAGQPAVQPTVPRGHVLVHHGEVLHCSRPNTSGRWRRAWIGVFGVA